MTRKTFIHFIALVDAIHGRQFSLADAQRYADDIGSQIAFDNECEVINNTPSVTKVEVPVQKHISFRKRAKSCSVISEDGSFRKTYCSFREAMLRVCGVKNAGGAYREKVEKKQHIKSSITGINYLFILNYD